MYNQIEHILLQYGYETIPINTPDIHLSLRQERREGYAVVTLDETSGRFLETEQFYHVSEQIRAFLRKRDCYYCHFLYLLVSDNDSSAGRLFQNYESFWRIVPGRGQVMVYETSEEGFMILRRPLEELFACRQANPQQNDIKYGGTQSAWQRLQNVFNNKKLPLSNILIIVINIVIFLYTDFFNAFSDESWLDAGALGWYEVISQGQWYRLLTSVFLHSNIEHIFNNMLVLAFMGSVLESELGRWKYGILYLGSGILAGCASMVYNMLRNDYIVSIGASGAIFGTVGAMLYLVLFHKGKRERYSVRQIAWMAFLSLYGGLTSQGVDNAAHIGGFFAGFLLAALLMREKPQREKRDYA